MMFFTSMTLTVAQGAIIAVGLPPGTALIAVGFAAAPGAPIFALLIAAVANNKVQAFAYMKLFGLGPVLATGAWFLPEPWQVLAAIYPPFCASKVYWVAASGGSEWPFWVMGALVTSMIWIGFLQRLYMRAARK